MALFRIFAVTKERYFKEIYTSSERQVHMTGLADGDVGSHFGHYLDPKDFPEAERFLIVTEPT